MSDDPLWLELCRSRGFVPNSPRDANSGSNQTKSTSVDGMEFLLPNYQSLLRQSPLFAQYQTGLNQNSQSVPSPEMVNSNGSHNPSHSESPGDDVEVSSPNKKRKAIAKGKKKYGLPKGKHLDMDCEDDVVVEVKGVPNKRWDPVCSDCAVEVLAELAKQGLKVDKSFKRQAFVNCARAVNEKFNETYTPENVANHLRTLKTKWNHITFIRNLSGAGFDDDQKMICLIGKPLEDFKLAHPNLMCYVNKPLKLYEELRIVAGEDQATGSFKKGVYQQFGDVRDRYPKITIDLEGTPHNEDNSVGPTFIGLGRASTSSGGPRVGVQSGPTDSENSRGSGRKRPAKDAVFDSLIDKVGEMTGVLAIAQKEKSDEKMSSAVYGMEGFDMQILDKAFEVLFEDPIECRKFNARPPNAKRMWMDKFQSQLISDGGQAC